MRIAYLALIFSCLVAVRSMNAQGTGEWVNQKATQTKYLLQQVAGLQVYLTYAKKGYKVAKNGLAAIKSLKQGHFRLDTGFFNSLTQVNPRIRKYPKVADIILMNSQTISKNKEILANVRLEGLINATEKVYIKQVLGNILHDASRTIESLVNIISDGKIKMTDDERIKRIDRLYDEAQDTYGFIKQFDKEIKVLSFQRAHELAEIDHYRTMLDK